MLQMLSYKNLEKVRFQTQPDKWQLAFVEATITSRNLREKKQLPRFEHTKCRQTLERALQHNKKSQTTQPLKCTCSKYLKKNSTSNNHHKTNMRNKPWYRKEQVVSKHSRKFRDGNWKGKQPNTLIRSAASSAHWCILSHSLGALRGLSGAQAAGTSHIPLFQIYCMVGSFIYLYFWHLLHPLEASLGQFLCKDWCS